MTIEEYYDRRIIKFKNDPELVMAINSFKNTCMQWEDKYTVDGVKYIRAEEIFGLNKCKLEDLDPVERWVELEEFPGVYLSESGCVWSSVTKRFIPLRYNEYAKSRANRYPKIVIDQRRPLYLHRMLGKYFIPNPNQYPIVRHLDDDPCYWHLDNLQWGTYSDNCKDAIKNGLREPMPKNAITNSAKNRRKPTKAINLNTGEIRYYAGRDIAARHTGVNETTIWAILTNRISSKNGYTFEEGA